MGKRVELTINFKAAYVPLPLEMVEARRAGMLLLLQLIEEEIENERQRSAGDCGDGGVRSLS